MANTTTIIKPAPAKINLMLRILGKRSDGYHNLQTVFQFIGLEDILTFNLTFDGKITLTGDQVSTNAEENIIYLAAKKLHQNFANNRGVTINLEKNIPIGAGLGGGSSDAATTLVVLNQLWDLQYSQKQLMDIGVKLGADVPVFIYGKSSWGEGVGEQLKPITIAEEWYVVIIPNCSISTAKIFCHSELTRDSNPITMSQFFAGNMINDCEELVRKIHLEVDYAMSWLSNYSKSYLTGTGSCIYAKLNNEDDASNIVKQLPDNLLGFVTKGCNTSSLFHNNWDVAKR